MSTILILLFWIAAIAATIYIYRQGPRIYSFVMVNAFYSVPEKYRDMLYFQ